MPRSVEEFSEQFGGVTLRAYASDRFDSVVEDALDKQCEGDFSSAGKLYKTALELASHLLPADNADVLAMECHLATALLKQQQYESAQRVLRKTLTSQSRFLDKGHPLLLSTTAKLADAYFGQGNFRKAELAYSEALTGLVARVGEGHPSCVQLKARLTTARKHERLESMRRAKRRKELRSFDSWGTWAWEPRAARF